MFLIRPRYIFYILCAAALISHAGGSPSGASSSRERPEIPGLYWHIDGPPSPRTPARNYIGGIVAEGVEIETYQRTTPEETWMSRYFQVIRGWGAHNTIVVNTWAAPETTVISSLAIIGPYVDLEALPFRKSFNSLMIRFEEAPIVVGTLPLLETPTLRWLSIHYDLRHGDTSAIHDTLEHLLLTFVRYRVALPLIYTINLTLEGEGQRILHQYDPDAPYEESILHDGWTWEAVFSMLKDALHPDSPKRPEALARLYERIAALDPAPPSFLRVLEDTEEESTSEEEEEDEDDTSTDRTLHDTSTESNATEAVDLDAVLEDDDADDAWNIPEAVDLDAALSDSEVGEAWNAVGEGARIRTEDGTHVFEVWDRS